jgi:two-component system response regulator PilR (NtrC family)
MTGTRVRVLVADDDQGIRETTSLILKSCGYAVTEAIDGEDAMEQLNAEPHDVAVLDVRMPRRDGLWVVEHVHPAPPPPGIILASAYALDQQLRDRLGGRVVRYLRKPVAPRDLIEAVGAAAPPGSGQGPD